jgi:hypothetical protein
VILLFYPAARLAAPPNARPGLQQVDVFCVRVRASGRVLLLVCARTAGTSGTPGRRNRRVRCAIGSGRRARSPDWPCRAMRLSKAVAERLIHFCFGRSSDTANLGDWPAGASASMCAGTGQSESMAAGAIESGPEESAPPDVMSACCRSGFLVRRQSVIWPRALLWELAACWLQIMANNERRRRCCRRRLRLRRLPLFQFMAVANHRRLTNPAAPPHLPLSRTRASPLFVVGAVAADQQFVQLDQRIRNRSIARAGDLASAQVQGSSNSQVLVSDRSAALCACRRPIRWPKIMIIIIIGTQ